LYLPQQVNEKSRGNSNDQNAEANKNGANCQQNCVHNRDFPRVPIRVARPCRYALFRELIFSPGVRGTLLREALRLLDLSFRIEIMTIVDLLGCDLLDPGRLRIGLKTRIDGLAGTDTKFPADGNLPQHGVQMSPRGQQEPFDGG
jgi:hypothetical protein